MQWRGFEGLRTYERPLQNDLRELERFLRDLNDRVGRNIQGEPISSSPTITIAPHAFTHATATANNLAGGTDPLGPWEFVWTHEHTFAPLFPARVPITITASLAQTANLIEVTNSANTILTIMDEQGDVAIGTSDSTGAHLTVQGRAFGEADILGMSPWGWWDASDPAGTNGDILTRYSSIANGSDVNPWVDRTPNSRDWPYDSVVNRAPKFWKIASSGTGSPSALPGSGLPVVSTVDAGSGARAFGDITHAAGDPGGTVISLGTGSYTIYVVGQTVSPIGSCNIAFMGSQNAGGVGDVSMYVGPDATGAPDSCMVQYRTNPSGGAQHRYSRALNALTGNNYWHFAFQRESGVAHHIWQEGVEITTVGAGDTGTPLSQPFLVQWLAKTQNNVGSNTLWQYHFCEVIIFNTAHDATTRASIWNYLNNKWSLAGSGAAATSKNLQRWNSTAGTVLGRFTGTGRLGIGSGLDPSVFLHTVGTTEQTRTGYDTSNYYSTTVGSTGSTTFNLVGTSPTFTFTDPVIIDTAQDSVQLSVYPAIAQSANLFTAYYYDAGPGLPEPYFALGAGDGATNYGVVKLGYLGSGSGRAWVQCKLSAADAADANVAALTFDIATTLSAANAMKWTNTSVSKDYMVLGPGGTISFGYIAGLTVDTTSAISTVGSTSNITTLNNAFGTAVAHDNAGITPTAINAVGCYVSHSQSTTVPTNGYSGLRSGCTVLVAADTAGASAVELAAVAGVPGITSYTAPFDRPNANSALRGNWKRVSMFRAGFIGTKASAPSATLGARPLIFSCLYAPMSPYVDGTTGESWGVEIDNPASTNTPTTTPIMGGVKIAFPRYGTRQMHLYYVPTNTQPTGNASGDTYFDSGVAQEAGLWQYTTAWAKLIDEGDMLSADDDLVFYEDQLVFP